MNGVEQCEVIRDAPPGQQIMPDVMYKVIVVGEPSVGKSCILVRAIKNEFKDEYEVTIGAESSPFLLKLQSKLIQLQIWDTAGMEKFRSMIKVFFTGANAACLVYDITRKDTFEALDGWYNTLKESTSANIKIVLVGNKKDQEGLRQVTYELGADYAKKQGFWAFFETSAKSGEGIESMFIQLAHVLYTEYEGPKEPTTVVTLDSKTPTPSKKKKCC